MYDPVEAGRQYKNSGICFRLAAEKKRWPLSLAAVVAPLLLRPLSALGGVQPASVLCSSTNGTRYGAQAAMNGPDTPGTFTPRAESKGWPGDQIDAFMHMQQLGADIIDAAIACLGGHRMTPDLAALCITTYWRRYAAVAQFQENRGAAITIQASAGCAACPPTPASELQPPELSAVSGGGLLTIRACLPLLTCVWPNRAVRRRPSAGWMTASQWPAWERLRRRN